MSTEEIDSLKELFNEKLSGLTTLMNAQFNNVNEQLQEINEHVQKTNGRVLDLEKKEISHIINCPNISKIQSLENDVNKFKTIKSFIYTILIILGTIAGASYSIIKIFG